MTLILAGFVVGVLVGATGVGGGSILAPVLVLVFGMNPLTAVGTDLFYSAPTKIAGSVVHVMQKTLLLRPFLHLTAGGLIGVGISSAAVLQLGRLISMPALAHLTKQGVGAALVLSSLLLLYEHFTRAKDPHREAPEPHAAMLWISGACVAAIVTLTSVGAGALAMPLLCMFYRRRALSGLVGTDVSFAAIVGVAAAAVRFGQGYVDVPVAMLLLCGSIPGVILGSRFALVGGRWLRPVLVTTLFGAGLRML